MRILIRPLALQRYSHQCSIVVWCMVCIVISPSSKTLPIKELCSSDPHGSVQTLFLTDNPVQELRHEWSCRLSGAPTKGGLLPLPGRLSGVVTQSGWVHLNGWVQSCRPNPFTIPRPVDNQQEHPGRPKRGLGIRRIPAASRQNK